MEGNQPKDHLDIKKANERTFYLQINLMIVARDFFLPGRLTFCIVVLSLSCCRPRVEIVLCHPSFFGRFFTKAISEGLGRTGKKFRVGFSAIWPIEGSTSLRDKFCGREIFSEKKTFVRNLWTRRDVLWTREN